MLSPAKTDLAVVRLVDAGDQVEERRLAGAVRADHADDLALVDVQVEVGHDLEAAERQRDAAAARAAVVGHQMISTRRSPRSPFGPGDHQRDQDRAEHDVARRLGLGEHHVLPDERGEVERRHQQDDAAPSRCTSVRTSTSAISADVRDRRDPAAEVRGHDDPVRRARETAAAGGAPAIHVSSIACRDGVRDEAEARSSRRARSRAASDSSERATSAEQHDDVEQRARVAGLAQQLEQHADDHRAERRRPA